MKSLRPAPLLNFFVRRQKALVECFGPDRRMKEFTIGDADSFRTWLLGQDFAENTVRRLCGRTKQFFRATVRRKLIPENPFGDLVSAVRGNASRFYYVTKEEATKVLDACPDVEWRLLFALSRYGGLRCPSEHLSLRWGDVDWANNRVRVPSPKTEHIEGKESRMIPMFPELKPYLEEAFEQAAVFVNGKVGATNAKAPRLPGPATSCDIVNTCTLPPRGVEQSSKPSGKRGSSQTRDAQNDAVAKKGSVDPGLLQVIAAWRTLPQALRRAILAIVESQA